MGWLCICLLVGEGRLIEGSATLPREARLLHPPAPWSWGEAPSDPWDCPQGPGAGWQLALQEPHFCGGPASADAHDLLLRGHMEDMRARREGGAARPAGQGPGGGSGRWLGRGPLTPKAPPQPLGPQAPEGGEICRPHRLHAAISCLTRWPGPRPTAPATGLLRPHARFHSRKALLFNTIFVAGKFREFVRQRKMPIKEKPRDQTKPDVQMGVPAPQSACSFPPAGAARGPRAACPAAPSRAALRLCLCSG